MSRNSILEERLALAQRRAEDKSRTAQDLVLEREALVARLEQLDLLVPAAREDAESAYLAVKQIRDEIAKTIA